MRDIIKECGKEIPHKSTLTTAYKDRINKNIKNKSKYWCNMYLSEKGKEICRLKCEQLR